LFTDKFILHFTTWQFIFTFKVVIWDKRFLIGLLLLCSFVGFCQETATADTTKAAPEEELFKKAVKLIDSARYKEAIADLKKAIKIKPDYPAAYTKMGIAKIKLKDIKGAEKDLKTALTGNPNDFETLKTMGFMYFNIENYKECKIFFDSAASIATTDKIDDAEFYFYRAKLMFIGKSYKTALDMLAAAIEIKPKYVEAFVLKGEIRFAQKDYNYAIKELNEGIAMMKSDQLDYSAYKTRAKAKFEIQDYKGAITDWSVYLDGNPGEEEALIARGAARININDHTNALVDLDEAIKKNPKNPVSYNYRGMAKAGNKQFVEGLKDINYAIQLKFDYAAAYVNRAAIKFASKDKRGACEDLNKADTLGDPMAYKLIEQYCKGMNDNRK
jgi:tetratricopeptide (TPR) repeat protein